MQIISTAIIKGGTGKTTTAAALAQAAAADGQRVLCIDLDAQGNLSLALAADVNTPGSYELLLGEDPGELIQTTKQKLDVIPAGPNLVTLTTKTGSAWRLQKALLPIRDNYDLIIIDTPPQIGEVTFNALQASTGIISALVTDNFSLQGLYQIADIAAQVQKSNAELQHIGAMISRYDGRGKIYRMMRDVIASKCKELDIDFYGAVRAGVAIGEAQALQLSLFDYAPNSKQAQDYNAIYSAIKKEYKLNKKCKK